MASNISLFHGFSMEQLKTASALEFQSHAQMFDEPTNNTGILNKLAIYEMSVQKIQQGFLASFLMVRSTLHFISR